MWSNPNASPFSPLNCNAFFNCSLKDRWHGIDPLNRPYSAHISQLDSLAACQKLWKTIIQRKHILCRKFLWIRIIKKEKNPSHKFLLFWSISTCSKTALKFHWQAAQVQLGNVRTIFKVYHCYECTRHIYHVKSREIASLRERCRLRSFQSKPPRCVCSLIPLLILIFYRHQTTTKVISCPYREGSTEKV